MTNIIDTPGAAANSYASLAYAESYHIDRLHNSDWKSSTSNLKRASLVWATRTLENLYWKGTKGDSDNSLHWPASGVYDKYGAPIDSEAVPDIIKNACCELAYHMTDRDVTTDKSEPEFKKLSIGPIDMEFKGNGNELSKVDPIPPAVKAMIKGFLRGNVGGVIR